MKRMISFWALVALSGCGDVGLAESYDSYPIYDSSVGAPISEQAGETYNEINENDWIDTAEEDTSTFSIDVDTAAYTIMRRDVRYGVRPDPDSIRIEEYINYFDYAYPEPEGNDPLGVTMDMAPSEFGEGKHLLRIGVRGQTVAAEDRKPANLVFLIDTSGSMSSSGKLDLVVYALKELVRRLEPTDTLGIVVYAGGEGVALSPTPISDKAAIYDVLDGLSAGGGTNGEGGIRAAYRLAREAFREGGINRVVLATDGDFNIGLTGDDLIALVESYRDQDVTLTTLGVGYDNLNDATLEQLADRGNGNYGYIDNRGEAVRMLGDELVSTLQVIAKDVKIQVEFDPEVVSSYRLIGYENRLLANEDFADDTRDAGEIGAGHTVTALYEVSLVAGADAGAAATVRLRYKAPDGDESVERTFPLDLAEVGKSFSDASDDTRFAAAVAEYGELLRGSMHSTGERWDDVLAILEDTHGDAADRLELVDLVRQARVNF